MKVWGILICLALPVLARGQSLGEAAKKERDRRDKLREAQVTARTLTAQDLAANKGTLANDPNETVAGPDGETKPGAHAADARLPPTRSGVPSNGGEGYWRARVAAARARVEEAQLRCDAFDRMIRFGQPAAYDGNGGRVIYSIYQMKQMADRAAAELASAQAALENVLEEGRRSGALPGWLR